MPKLHNRRYSFLKIPSLADPAKLPEAMPSPGPFGEIDPIPIGIVGDLRQTC